MTVRRRRQQSFVEFVTDVLHLSLTVPWRVLLKVAIDGVQPRQLCGVEREIARQLFGDVDEIDPDVRRILVWRLGRASGKSTLAAALTIWAAWTGDLSHVGPGQLPCSFVVSPTKPLAKICLGIARELVRESALEAHVVELGDNADGFVLRRPDGKRVQLRSVAASKGGANLRGVDVLALVLDESEFFGSGEDFAVTDRDQIDAVMPRLIGFVVCSSTPWPTENATAEYFTKNWGQPTDALCALGPSNLMRPSARLERDIAREMERDPETAKREYFCEEVERGGLHLFAGVLGCVNVTRPLSLPPTKGHNVGAGVDLGFEKNSSTLAIVDVDRMRGLNKDARYILCHLDELRPTKEVKLQPSRVCAEFAATILRYGARRVMADHWYRQSAVEHFRDHGVRFDEAPEGSDGKAETYLALKVLVNEQRIELPNHGRLIAQMRAVLAKPKPLGGYSIISPRRAGGSHGDLVSALVLAVEQATRHQGGERSSGGAPRVPHRQFHNPLWGTDGPIGPFTQNDGRIGPFDSLNRSYLRGMQ